MMNEMLNITHVQGGMREFERTGIYPEYLLFNLSGTRRNWKIRVKQTPQQGVLKSNGEVVYEYSFNGNWCKFRKVEKDGSFSKWMDPDVMMSEMRD